MSQLSRRCVLRLISVAAGATALPLVFADTALAGGGLRRSAFTPFVGSSFLLVRGGVRQTATLRAVADQNRVSAGSATRFSLLFDLRVPVPAGIYQLRRAGVPEISLYLGPVSGRAGRYECVVSS
jgi:hypothetical protein